MNKHLHQPPADNLSSQEDALALDNLELIVAEVKSLRAKLNLLESRLDKISEAKATNNSEPVPPVSVDAQSPTSMPMPPVESIATGVASANHKVDRAAPETHATDKTPRNNSDRGKRRRRSSMVRKTKKNLLFVYLLIVAGGIISLFAFTMVNLFSSGEYRSLESSAPIEIKIEETSGLGELRRSIQGSDE